MADTKLTVKEIELALRNSGLWNKRNDVMLPNLSWGLLNHEADFCVITKSGYLTEVEIKRSFTDLKADFKKDVFHKDERVYKFYYCLPESIVVKSLELFKENEEKIKQLYNTDYYHDPALLVYDEHGAIKHEGGYPYRGGRKLFLEEREIVGRLMSLRYWDMQEKLNKEKKDGRIEF